jgi:hypothetical protein
MPELDYAVVSLPSFASGIFVNWTVSLGSDKASKSACWHGP